MRKNHLTYLAFLLLILFIGCNKKNTSYKQEYEKQIGDTQFDKDIDSKKFKFCNNSNVLHKRARIQYTGGNKTLEKDLIKNFKFLEEYSLFNGYCIVRLGVNCNDESGRYRLETLDKNFNFLKFPIKLETSLLLSIKKLKGWKHPRFNDKDYDGYTFFIIKITNGIISIP